MWLKPLIYLFLRGRGGEGFYQEEVVVSPLQIFLKPSLKMLHKRLRRLREQSVVLATIYTTMDVE